MADRRKRTFDQFDPNKSDSDDGDFNLREANASTRSRNKKTGRSAKPKPRKPAAKRARRDSYGGSDDDVEIDGATSSEESFNNLSDKDEDIKINSKTGRGIRAAAANSKKSYLEPSSDDEELEIQNSDPEVQSPIVKTESVAPRESLIVKLKIPGGWTTNKHLHSSTTSRAGSRVNTRGMTPLRGTAMGTRRSSRISHEPENDLIALTDSGRHARITRRGTATPDPQPQPQTQSRATRNTRGMKKLPSAIIEASQEEIPASQDYSPPTAQDDILSQLLEHAAVGKEEGGVEAKLEIGASDAETPSAPVPQPDDDDDAQGEVEPASQDEAVDPEQEDEGDGDVDDDDDDDEPVKPRAGRGLRVSLPKLVLRSSTDLAPVSCQSRNSGCTHHPVRPASENTTPS